jgi:hypothetical protein
MPELDLLLEQAIKAHIRRVAYAFMGLLIGYVVVRGVVGAAAKPFWLDELLTITIAGQASLAEMWKAIARGFDSAPPVFYLVERAALSLPLPKEVAARLPSILAFPFTAGCVFVYVRKRSGELIACLCVTLLLSTTLLHTFLIEARGYGLMIACVAFALVCYQRLPGRTWTIFLGISLFLAESFHYYAVFALIPFGLAEVTRSVLTRKIRWAVYSALACGILPLIAFWRFVSTMKTYYGEHLVFSHPPLAHVADFYGSYFLVDPAFGVALALAAVVAIVWAELSPGLSGTTGIRKEDWPEGILLASLSLSPVVAFILVRTTHATLTSRHVVASIIGIVVGLACMLSDVRSKIVVAAIVFVLFSLGFREYSFWRTGHHSVAGELSGLSVQSLAKIQAFIETGGHPELPVVYGPDLVFPQMAYYFPQNTRIVCLIDEEKEANVTGADSNARIIEALREFTPLRLANYSQFIAAHSEFLLYSEDSDWVLPYLMRDAGSVQLLRIEGGGKLYLIRMKNANE